AIQNDQGWAVLLLPENAQGVTDAIDVVGVANSQHVPPIGQKPACNVLREGDPRAALNGDVVVVVNPAEVVQSQVAGERRRFRPPAFQQAALSARGIDFVVEDLEAGPFVGVREPLLCDSHTDAGSDTLSERAGCGFNTRYQVVFGMPGRLATDLTE